MGDHHSRLPSHLNPCDPNFSRDMKLWRVGLHCELDKIIAKTKETVDQTKVLIAEADRILALR